MQNNTPLIARHRLEAHLRNVAFGARNGVEQERNRVTQRREHFAPRREDAAYQHRYGDHGRRMAAALLLIAFKQALRSQAADDCGEFPGDIADIAYATVIALALPDWHEMRGVSGEERAPGTDRAASLA